MALDMDEPFWIMVAAGLWLLIAGIFWAIIVTRRR